MHQQSTIQTTILLMMGTLLWASLSVALGGVATDTAVAAPNQQEEELVAGTYEGTIGVAEPVALGTLDLVITLESSSDNQITGTVDGERTQLFRDNPSLSGVITDTGAITPTFRIEAAPFGRVVNGRPVQRTFSLIGEVQQAGNVLAGQYQESVRGFTPEPLIVRGDFLLTRPAAQTPVEPNAISLQ